MDGTLERCSPFQGRLTMPQRAAECSHVFFAHGLLIAGCLSGVPSALIRSGLPVAMLFCLAHDVAQHQRVQRQAGCVTCQPRQNDSSPLEQAASNCCKPLPGQFHSIRWRKKQLTGMDSALQGCASNLQASTNMGPVLCPATMLCINALKLLLITLQPLRAGYCCHTVEGNRMQSK